MQKEVKTEIIQFFKKTNPGKILDIPCGDGWLKKELQESLWDYYGADLFTNPDITNFKKIDLNKAIPYQSDFYDYVACFEGLEHIENYHLATREFHRILKKEGVLLISTPNILNIKSRKRFFLYGTYYGFPHLINMRGGGGEHLHMNPINLSFLLSFCEKYGFKLNQIHRINIKAKMYRYFIHCIIIKLYCLVKMLFKDNKTKQFMDLLTSFNILLNDSIFVSFKKV